MGKHTEMESGGLVVSSGGGREQLLMFVSFFLE